MAAKERLIKIKCGHRLHTGETGEGGEPEGQGKELRGSWSGKRVQRKLWWRNPVSFHAGPASGVCGPQLSG